MPVPKLLMTVETKAGSKQNMNLAQVQCGEMWRFGILSPGQPQSCVSGVQKQHNIATGSEYTHEYEVQNTGVSVQNNCHRQKSLLRC